ncbi:MAG: AbrB/MazE/SpoVT family DNA-binding domain-containing protein [Microthrixaceae bacterium]
MDATVSMSNQGRIVIPVAMRNRLGLKPGEALHLFLSGSRLVIERPEDALGRLRGMAAGVPSTRSLVDELIAERRAEARGDSDRDSDIDSGSDIGPGARSV